MKSRSKDFRFFESALLISTSSLRFVGGIRSEEYDTSGEVESARARVESGEEESFNLTESMVSPPLPCPPPSRAEYASEAGYSTSDAPSGVVRFERETAFER